MALYTKLDVEDNKRAAVLLLTFDASTGYSTKDVTQCLFHNQTKANAALKTLMKNARTLGASWASGSIIELFRDKDTGMFLQAEGVANMSMSFGKKP